ncbi:MAG: hypothetical protein M1813_008691 [Trichoglossum hirsutum]|nr:MAG: hypothetical protein M1813_008691 [Trichoglossum hirsutum]
MNEGTRAKRTAGGAAFWNAFNAANKVRQGIMVVRYTTMPQELRLHEPQNTWNLSIRTYASAVCFRADENQHRLPSVVFDCPGGPVPELRSESSPLFCSGSPYRQGLRDDFQSAIVGPEGDPKVENRSRGREVSVPMCSL